MGARNLTEEAAGLTAEVRDERVVVRMEVCGSQLAPTPHVDVDIKKEG